MKTRSAFVHHNPLVFLPATLQTSWFKLVVIWFGTVMMLFSPPAYAQNSWAQQADLPGAPRTFAISFAIGTNVYIGTGAAGDFSAKKDFWEYNTITSTWTQKADFAGAARFGAIGFSINGKGYVALGNGNFGQPRYKDVWEYNPISDSWTQLDDFEGGGRTGATVFVVGGKAYVGMGQGVDPANPSQSILFKDLWLFDLGNPDQWTRKSDLPSDARYYAGGFSIGATGYLCGGTNVTDGIMSDFWQYNPVSDSWSQKANFAGGATSRVPGFSLKGKGYMLSGNARDFWQYDPTTNAWSERATLNQTARVGTTAVSLNGKAYVGMGLDDVSVNKEFYEYTPENDPVVAGKMYGPGGGGVTGRGVIYRASATGTGLTSIYNFDVNGLTGSNPSGRLTEINGKLYGTTLSGGATTPYGVLFQLDLTGNVYTRLLDFSTYGSVGCIGGMTLAGGKLYGSARGNNEPHGFIFEFDPATNIFTKKAQFNGTNGSDPYGELLLVGDKLYSTTYAGGTNGHGVIFEYDFRNNVITKKADFTGANGSQPRAGLTEFSGLLYGLTPAGGASDKGVLYEFDISTGTINKWKDFSGNDGELPYGGLTVLHDKLYGTASDMGTGYTGVIFEFDPATHVFTKKFDFNNTTAYTGSDPSGTLTAINGKLYGTTSMGGDNNKGVIFSYDLTNGFSKISDADDGTGNPGNITFVRDNQTLNFNPLPAKVVGDAPFQLTANGSPGLVQFVSSNQNVATINGSTVTITGAGTTTITASVGSNSHFTLVNQNLVVNKKTQTVTFNALAAKTFGDGSFDLTASTTSGLSVSFSSDNTNVATINGNTVTIVGAGTATITAKQSGNSIYAAAEATSALTVGKANQTITFNVLSDKTFGASAFQLNATTTSGLPITFESSDVLVAGINGTTLTVGSAGNSTITARQAGNGNYNAAIAVPRSLTVAKASQEIVFSELPIKTEGDASFTLTATTTLLYTPTYSSSDPTVAIISGSTVTITGVGQTIISANHPGNANVLPAPTATRTLTVKASQTITFNSPGTVTYVPTIQLNAIASSGLVVQYTSDTPEVATISGSLVTIHKVGSTKITASQPGNNSFSAAAPVSHVLTVTKANQVITFEAVADQIMGSPPFNLSASSTSGLPVSFSTTSDKIQISGKAVTLTAAGSVIISAVQAGNDFYNVAPTVQKSFCIAPRKPEITLSNTSTDHPVLTSSATIGNQWYLNGVAIAGETKQTLTVSVPGDYKVRTSVDGCVSDFSDNFSIIITGIEESPTNEKISIYPNPADDKLTIAMPHDADSKVTLLKSDGSVVLTLQSSSTIFDLDISDYSPGLYVLKIQNSKSQFIGRFIKK